MFQRMFLGGGCLLSRSTTFVLSLSPHHVRAPEQQATTLGNLFCFCSKRGIRMVALRLQVRGGTNPGRFCCEEGTLFYQ